ncbi:hypothetical protein Tco_0825618, partial [Tanacetum coccineum]
MSDSEDSTVTYMEVSSPFEGLSDIGSPRVVRAEYEGLPWMLDDPYVQVVLQAPPSPDYMSGPEDPEQAPPLPDFVPEPVYLEFMPLEDEVFPVEEHPLPAAASPTADSPGYVLESDSEEDHEEDPADYLEEEEEHLAPADSTAVALPAVDHASSTEKIEPFETDEFAATPPHHAYRVTAMMSIRDEPPTPFWSEAEIARLLAIPSPPPSPLFPWSSPLPQIPSSPLPQIPSPPLPVSPPSLVSPLPLPASPTYPLRYRVAMIRLRAEAPSTFHPLPLSPWSSPLSPWSSPSLPVSPLPLPASPTVAAPSTYILAPRSEAPPSGTPPLLPIPLPTSSPPLLLPSTNRRADVREACLPPRKRLCFAFSPRYKEGESSSAPTARPDGDFRRDYGVSGAPATNETELGRWVTDLVMTVRQDTDEIYGRLDDAQTELQMNGNSFKLVTQTTTNDDGTSTSNYTKVCKLLTIKDQKKNDVKAKSMLLMALLNEHLMTFNQYKDAKTLFAAIQKRFDGNEAAKKTQKTLLKQMYENFSAPSIESLDSIFNRLQNIISQLAILGENISQEDLNLKFLRNVEQEVKGTASSSSSSSSQNMAFVSSLVSSNDVNTIIKTGFYQLVYEDLEQIHEDDIEEMDLKWQLALLSMRTKRNQDSSRRTVNVEETSSKAMVAIDGAGFDWSYMEDDEVPTNMALMAFSDSKLEKLKQGKESNQLKIENFDNASKSLDKLIGSQIPDKSRKGVGFISYNVIPPPHTGLFSPLNFDLSNSSLEEFLQPKFEGYGPKTSKSFIEDTSNEVRESPDAPLVEELVSNDKIKKKTIFPTVAKIEFVRPKQQEKPIRKPIKSAEMYSFDHVQADCNYHQRERVVSGNNYTRVNYNYSAKKAHRSAHRNMAPRAVLMKTGLRSLNTARPVNTTHPKTIAYSARPIQKVNTAKGKFYTPKPKAVNTARPNSAVVNAVRANQGHPQKEDQGYV